MRLPFLNSISLGGSIALMCLIGLSPARVSAQNPGDAVLNKTTFGQSQNDGRDYMNSLTPGEKKYGKHEKKEEVNSGQLKSNSLKDTTFGGSLLNMGIVGAEPKLDESKHQVAESLKDSSSVKQSAATEKEPMLQLSDSAIVQPQADPSDGTTGDKQAKATGGNATAPGSETQNKAQTTTAQPAKDQKPSTASSEKPTKPDGDH